MHNDMARDGSSILFFLDIMVCITNKKAARKKELRLSVVFVRATEIDVVINMIIA